MSAISRLIVLLAACGLSAVLGYHAGKGTVVASPPISLASVTTPIAPAVETTRIGLVDLSRLFAAHPKTKVAESAINAKREEARIELQRLRDSGDTDAANQFSRTRKEEIENESALKRKEIADDLVLRAVREAKNRGLNLLFDSSGKSLNSVPFVLYGSDLIDITDDALRALQSN
jgi:Skp family chaperone for outer membrane proteins